MLPSVGRTAVVFLAILVTAGNVSAQLPDTPAARQFSAWLAAFNSGDRDRIARYNETHYPSSSADGSFNFYSRTGGLDLRKVEQSTPTTVVGLVQERASDQFARFTVEVEAS